MIPDSGAHGMSPGSTIFPLPRLPLSSFFKFAHADLFSPFSPNRSLVPGYNLESANRGLLVRLRSRRKKKNENKQSENSAVKCAIVAQRLLLRNSSRIRDLQGKEKFEKIIPVK